MIQFNLLPDVKLDYIKARRSKHTVVLASVIVASVALGILFLLLFTVQFLQKQHMSNLSDDIAEYSSKLEEQEELNRVLTVQNQLNKLPELHNGKTQLSRLRTYMPQITPSQLDYKSIDVDVDTALGTIEFTGKADSIKTVNQYADTLKFTEYTVEGAEGKSKAFSEVVLSNFGTDENGVRYSITFKYDPVIFDSESKVTLVVPNTITTRSAIERPDDSMLQSIDSSQSGGM